MQTNKPEMTKNVYYAEDIKQSFYLMCKAKLMKEQNRVVLVKGMGYLFACRNLVTSSVSRAWRW